MKMTDEQRKALRIRVDYTNMTDKYLGNKGFSREKLASYGALAQKAHAYVSENRGRDELFMG